MRKRVVFTLIAAMIFAGIPAGCSGTEEPAEDASGEISVQTEDEETEENTEENAQEETDDPSAGNAEAESSDSEAESYVPEEYRIDNFPIIGQMPELPTGCEITALTMALQYYGYDADKVTMASEYLPTAGTGNYYGDDGRLYGNDLNQYFIGDPFTEGGIICGTGAIISAADVYLENQGSIMRAVDRSGSSPEQLYELVSRNIPVVVWVTIGMQDRHETQG